MTPVFQARPGTLTWSCGEHASAASAGGDFAELLRRLRLRAGLSQQQLASRIGTTQSAVARLEAGSTQPKITTLSKLAAALGEDLLISVQGRKR